MQFGKKSNIDCQGPSNSINHIWESRPKNNLYTSLLFYIALFFRFFLSFDFYILRTMDILNSKFVIYDIYFPILFKISFFDVGVL